MSLLDMMEQLGIIHPINETLPRQVAVRNKKEAKAKIQEYLDS